MIRICTGSRIKLLLLLLPCPLIAQHTRFDTLAFYNHLVKEHLQLEQIAFNSEWMQWHKGNISINDSSLLNNSILYYDLNAIDSSGQNLLRISKNTDFTEYSERHYLSMLILQNKLKDAETELSGNKAILKSGLYFNDAGLSLKMLNREKIDMDTGKSGFSMRMKVISSEYEKAPYRSPFLAGIYSVILPGLGKLYLGYKYQAITAFTANALLAGQSLESYVRAGPGSARFIISASLFGLFYGGNILGSIILAKKQRHDYLKQIDHEIFDFHNAVVGKPAY
jgi:hypothetical protein